MATIAESLKPILDGRDIDFDQAKQILDLIFEGQVPEVQIAAFLTAMRIKRPTAEEIAGFASSLRGHAVTVQSGLRDLVDTCGTGGGAVKTCNVSTAAAIVAAGAGVYVAKHGNRGITSNCGSADVLEALGVKIDAPASVVASCIRGARIGFMYAPLYHPAMRVVQPVRKALGFRTIFNILGPLANPAGANRQVLGVADEALVEPVCNALVRLGTIRAMVVHSQGLDEISTVGPTTVMEIKDGTVLRYQIEPHRFGMGTSRLEELKVDGPADSARLIRQILFGKDTGPRRDIVLLNAAAAIMVGGLADDLEEGLAKAEAAINDGRAGDCLERLIKISHGQQDLEA